MMTIRFSLLRHLTLLGLLGGMLVGPTQAQTYPHPVSLQGLLLGADGNPLAGNYDLTFRIYDAPEGGSPLWTETHNSVLVSDGLYNVSLGLNPNLPPDLFTGLLRYLEVSVEGEVLRPRVTLQAVPIAYAAKTLTDGALQAGSNVTITRQQGGALRIDATGGGGGGGLSSVASDATLAGNGTSGNPLSLADRAVTGTKLADGALQAGSNVTITRQGNGALEIASTGGGGGGLASVASDATLAGNGTSGNPLSLADRAVTGAKIADGALVAGSNVAITRQAGGALEIASAGGGGLNLPFSGSTSSNGPALSIENTGSGDGIQINSAAGRWGVYVREAGLDGVGVSGTGRHGLWVNQAGAHGVQIDQAGNNGILIGQATFDGLQVQSAGRDGVRISAANNDGISIDSANRYGLNVVNASRGVDISTTTSDGIAVRSAGRHGLTIQNAASKGIQIDQAGNNGLQIDQAGLNGIQIGQTFFDGIQIQSPGRDGIRISGAAGEALRIDGATGDGIRIGGAGGYGIIATGTAGAGYFNGDVEVAGTLSKSGGSFKIDHPLDPANRYLSHSFVESPDMMNVYNGNAVLDAAGEAFVELPAYFETLNRDFRYQLTAIGAPGPNLYIAEEIRSNRFRIAGGAPGTKVSWQVTGIRRDAWADENRIVVEEDKPAEDRGYYLHPRLYGQPETRNVVRFDTPEKY